MGRANVELHRDGPIARVVLDRPDRRNALSLALMQEVIETLDDVAADTAARVVVVEGNGLAFSAGHDLAEM
ncbi:MAG TPA: enoyl-CoA hydratase-related protein, partial [Acidimicrobiia bacterium]|nr:enoyl-CoA hydratase-related protein [Acidimicrobiia bacterium]